MAKVAARNKVAIVTNVHSSQISATIAVHLVNSGMTVIVLSRDCHSIDFAAANLSDASGRLVPFVCDATKEDEIKAAFSWVIWEFAGIDLLINCTAMNHMPTNNSTMMMDTLPSQMRHIFDENIMAPIMCTREAYKSMTARGVAGCVINISSSLYCRQKPVSTIDFQLAALKALADFVRTDNNGRIRVTVFLFLYKSEIPTRLIFYIRTHAEHKHSGREDEHRRIRHIA